MKYDVHHQYWNILQQICIRINANKNTQLLPQITVYFPSFPINIGTKDILLLYTF